MYLFGESKEGLQFIYILEQEHKHYKTNCMRETRVYVRNKILADQASSGL